jgi:hypothetical protein
MAAHEANKARIQPDVKYDVVFLGDETTEGWSGKLSNLPYAGGKKTQKYWDETFTTDGGGDMEGLSLGIAGDSVRFSIHVCCEIILSVIEALDSYHISCSSVCFAHPFRRPTYCGDCSMENYHPLSGRMFGGC